jgi:hypothetical protein
MILVGSASRMLETLILATVSVAEDDGHPMTVRESAFLLDVRQRKLFGRKMLTVRLPS